MITYKEFINENHDYPIRRIAKKYCLSQNEISNILKISQSRVSQLYHEKVMKIRNHHYLFALLEYSKILENGGINEKANVERKK